MELRLWKNVNKKRNSTLVINRTPDATMDVVLKDDTSVDTPTFLLDNVDLSVNYAWWEGRFYFVDDIRRGITHQYELECTTDYLATFKSYIGDYTAFVERSARTYDPLVVDEAISTEAKIGYSSHETINLMYSLDNPSGFLNQTGCFLLRAVGLTGQDISSTGITTYILDDSDLATVFDFMFTESNFSDVFVDMAVKSFFNPFQYIVDLRWIPLAKTFFNPQTGAVVSGPVKFGWWTVQHGGGGVFNTYILKAQVLNKNFSLACPASKYGNGDFRRFDSKYTQFKAYIFGVGTIDISPVDVVYSDTQQFEGLQIGLNIDFTTGEMMTLVRRSDGTHPIGEFKSQFAIPIQISQVKSNLFDSTMNTLITGGTSIQAAAMARSAAGATMSLVGGGIKTIINVIEGIHAEVAAGIQGNGTNGNRASLLQMPYYILYLTAYNSCDIANVVNGRPLYRNAKISTLGGYTKCAGASVDIPGFAGDKEAVNNALNGGFYYE